MSPSITFLLYAQKEDSAYLYPVLPSVDLLQLAQTGDAVQLEQRIVYYVQMRQIGRRLYVPQRLDLIVADVELHQVFKLRKIAKRSQLHVIAADGE